ncbi:MAG TPA: hypothetical protein VJ801_07320 [Polyangia bacterium]|jgi:hypothetical protein|nr:hypothetical protein [Polyangia bacterium]
MQKLVLFALAAAVAWLIVDEIHERRQVIKAPLGNVPSNGGDAAPSSASQPTEENPCV